MDDGEGLLTILRLLTFPRIALELAMAAGAIFRFRGSAAGMLIGVPLLLDALLSIAFKLFHALGPSTSEEGGLEQILAFNAGGTCFSSILMFVVAVGLFLLPRVYAPKPGRPGAVPPSGTRGDR